MPKSNVHPVHTFRDWQVWPGSYDNPQPNGSYIFAGESPFKIDRKSLIASMGSCFAREIKTVLLSRGFNYICEEQSRPAAVHASAAWERVYNTFCMRQIFEYTFEKWAPDLRWWIAPESGLVQDPYRRTMTYESLAQAEQDFAHHIECSGRALSKAEYLILTLGLTEIWRDKFDGSVISLPSGPYVNEGGDMRRYEFRVSRYAENLANLEHIYDILKKHNSGCKLIVSVSPVHLWATFRDDSDVMSASCNSKSTLRAVADEFCAAHSDVAYFPAYEMATIYLPLLNKYVFTENNENFHVNDETIQFIMKGFFEHFCENG